METETTLVTKKSVLQDVRVVIQPSHWLTRFCRSEDERIKDLERWASDLNEFLRDHRSMNVNGVYVERETMDVCSHCGDRWELMFEGGKAYCACCGEPAEVK